AAACPRHRGADRRGLVAVGARRGRTRSERCCRARRGFRRQPACPPSAGRFARTMIDEADYVVIGAGSAGCVLANRLSEDGGNRVALLEYGGSDRSIYVRMPSALSI